MRFFFIGCLTLFISPIFSCPTTQDIYNFAIQGSKDSSEKISTYDLNEIPYDDEYKYQWGRFLAFRDIINYVETGYPIFYMYDPIYREGIDLAH